MEPLTPGRVTSRAGSPSLSHRAFPPFCPQPPHGAPSSLLCSPQLCQRDGLPVPFQIPAFLMPLGVRQVWASHTPSRLAAPCSRNGFVILRTGGSPSVALHPALRQRSYFRFRVGGAYPEGTCTPLTLRLGGALGAGRARETHPPKKKKGAMSNPSPAPPQSKPLQPISLHLIVLIVPTLQRGNADPDAPASTSATNHQQPHPPHHRDHGPLLPRNQAPAVGAGPARDTNPTKKEKGRHEQLFPSTPIA